ncbi:MAG: hypothetical protein V3U52_01170 [Thermoplasmata archaeon]
MGPSVYFAGAIKGDTSYEFAHSAAVDAIRSANLRVWSEKSADLRALSVSKSQSQVFKRDQTWLKKSVGLVAEVSGESFGTGWEIAYAQKVMLIPVLCLVNLGASIPSFIEGNSHSGMHLGFYRTKDDIHTVVRRFLQRQLHVSGIELGSETLEPVRPKDIEVEMPRHASWIEGTVGIGGYELTLCSLLSNEGSRASDRTRHVFSTMCVGKTVDERGFSDSASLFKSVTRRLKGLRRAVLFGDASAPSTNLGWLTCYAQWNNIQSVAAYSESTDVSWLILGQAPTLGHFSPPLIFRARNQSRLRRWSSGQPRSPSKSRRRERPPITPISFSSVSDLLQKTDRLLGLVARNYHSTEIPEEFQATLLESLKGVSPVRRKMWTEETEVRLLAECMIRDALWQGVTAAGIEATFLSGERAELIRLLRFHNYASDPKSLYSKIKHAVNYEEKAFAKNIRALKNIGILLKQPLRKNRKGLAKFGIKLPVRDQQARLSDYILTFVENQLVLTHFGKDLSDYLLERAGKRDSIIAMLNRFRPQVQAVIETARRSDWLEGMDYVIDDLSDGARLEILRWAHRYSDLDASSVLIT